MMLDNLPLKEALMAERYKAIQCEIEQMRIAASASAHLPGMGRRIVARLGRSLVALGRWLERMEQHEDLAQLVPTRDTGKFY